MKKKLLFLSLFVSLFTTSFSQSVYGNFIPKQYESNNGKMSYRVSKPKDNSKKYPLVIFLHGAGECGDDNLSQLANTGIGNFLSTSFVGQYESIILAPQCPADAYWANSITKVNDKFEFDFSKSDPTKSMVILMEFIKEWISDPSVDQNQVYIGGLSMGGLTTFELLWRMPNVFAAAFPICGGSTLDESKLKLYASKTPLWISHGSADDVVPVSFSRNIYQRLIQTNNKVRYTEYPNVKHTVWNDVFKNKELLPWLFNYTSIADGHYKIANGSNVLTINDNQLAVTEFVDGENQNWLISKATESSYKIQTMDGSNQFLSVDGTNLSLSPNANTTNQYWKLKEISEKGDYNIISEANGLALLLTNNTVSLVAGTNDNNQVLKINKTRTYLIGDATPNGWVQAGAQQMRPILGEDSILSWKGILRASDFKLMGLQYSWLPSINAVKENQSVGMGVALNTKINEIFSAYDFKYKMSKSGYYEVLYNTTKKTITVNEKVLDELYLIGSATPCGWNAGDPVKMEPVAGKEGVFEWEGLMTEGDFNFITTKNSWSPSINADVRNRYIMTNPMKLVITNGVQGDYKFKITKSAIYNISVNVQNWTIEVTEKQDKASLFLVGDATPNGWLNTMATPMERESEDVYTWEGELKTGHFKFITHLGTWNSIVPARKGHEQVITNYTHTLSDNYQGDYRFVIPETGIYKVKVSLSDMSMVLTKQPGNLIYLVGDATPNGWYNTKATPMTEIGDGIFKWTGTLTAGHFKFLTELGTWNSLVPYMGFSEKVTVGTTYYVSNNYQGDPQFILEKAGLYTVTVNLNTREMNLKESKLKSVIAESINSDFTVIPGDASVDIKVNTMAQIDQAELIDISGRILAIKKNQSADFNLGTNLSSGIYIVKVICAQKSYVQKVLIK